MNLSKKFQEFVYSLSTRDKYSEFDSRKSFNRVNKPETDTLLYSHHNGLARVVGAVPDNVNPIDGAHEVKLAWHHIKNWLARHLPDLNQSLASPCTSSDIVDFERDLNVKLPTCVVEFFKLTDGQSAFNENGSGGLIFGLKLMLIDEIVVMTENWRKVADTLTNEMSHYMSLLKIRGLQKVQMSHSASHSSLSLSVNKPTQKVADPLIPHQRSIPPQAVHASYAHPMWIPIITDEVGNCVGIDLSPPPAGPGVWGQVILFGRDFDTKYVVAHNFGDFLLMFANDLELGNWKFNAFQPEDNDVVGIEAELVFVDNMADNNTKGSGDEMSYLAVLRRRCAAKWVASLTEQDRQDVVVARTLQYLENEGGSQTLNIPVKTTDKYIDAIGEIGLRVDDDSDDEK